MLRRHLMFCSPDATGGADGGAGGDAGDDPKSKGGGDDAGQDGGGEETLESLRADRDKWKNMSRKHEGQAKTNSDAAKRLKEIEDANKSEAQKLADEKAASDKAAATAQGELLRLRVGMRKGLSESQAKRLIGSTE